MMNLKHRLLNNLAPVYTHDELVCQGEGEGPLKGTSKRCPGQGEVPGAVKTESEVEELKLEPEGGVRVGQAMGGRMTGVGGKGVDQTRAGG